MFTKICKILTLMTMIFLTVSSSYALQVHNQSGKEIKVKTVTCSLKSAINTHQECKLKTINKQVSTANNTTITSDQKVVCSGVNKQSQFLTVNNIFNNDYLLISENLTNMPDNICLQIISVDGDKPAEAKVKKTCNMTVYSSISGLQTVYGDNCF